MFIQSHWDLDTGPDTFVEYGQQELFLLYTVQVSLYTDKITLLYPIHCEDHNHLVILCSCQSNSKAVFFCFVFLFFSLCL